jgi:glycerophosphoryl diester phosphodiesterase
MRNPLPLITAHSGCLGSPPNSRLHLDLALGSGADVVELDLRLSADGKVVLAHDAAIGGGGGLAIGETAYAGLAAAARDSGWELLSLDEALELLEGRDIGINLDAKVAEAAGAAAALLRRRGMQDRVVFSGLEEEDARRFRLGFPDFRCLLNADAILPASGYGLAEIEAACAVITESGACGLNLDWRAASPALMAYARLRCVPVLLWTMDSEAELLEAIEWGPWSITTHRPDLLSRLLGRGKDDKEGKA